VNVCWVNTTIAFRDSLNGVRLADLIDKPRPAPVGA
jgi:hypothetical protein